MSNTATSPTSKNKPSTTRVLFCVLLSLFVLAVLVATACWLSRWYFLNVVNSNNNTSVSDNGSHDQDDDCLEAYDQQHGRHEPPDHMLSDDVMAGAHPTTHPDGVPDNIIQLANANRDRIIHACGSVASIPPFNPKLWDDDHNRRFSNCYYFAFSELNSSIDHKIQPGEKSWQTTGMKPMNKLQLSCDGLVQRVLADHPSVKFNGQSPDCPCGYYEAGLVLSDKGSDRQRDYHFYRILKAGSYGHKPGSAPVTLIDASGKYITDGYQADWNYSKTGGPNYYTHCGSFCVPHLNEQVFTSSSHPLSETLDDHVPSMNDLPRL